MQYFIVHHDIQLKRSTKKYSDSMHFINGQKTLKIFDKTIFNDFKELDYPIFNGLFN